MKKIFFIILFCVCSFQSFTQNTFEFLLQGNSNQSPSKMIEDNNGNIICSIFNEHNALLIKLDNSGKLIDSLSIINTEGKCDIFNILKASDENFIGLGSYQIDTLNYLWFIKFNSNFDVLINNKIPSKDLSNGFLNAIINNSGNIILATQFKKPPSIYDYGICIYELTQNGDIVKSKYYDNTSGPNPVYDIIKDTLSFSYKIFTFNPLSKISINVINIDTNFNIIDNVYLSQNIEDQNSAKWISDNTYLLTGKHYNNTYKRFEQGILKLNRQDSIIGGKYFVKPDTTGWPGVINNLDFISNENIFYAGFLCLTKSPDYFLRSPTWINLKSLDTNLNLNWQKNYGGGARYILRAILATQDSGIVMGCSRYDYLAQREYLDAYIFKVNKEGIITSIGDEPIINQKACFIYPNPGNEYFFINTCQKELIINMFNINGYNVLTQNINYGINKIATNKLSSGTYIYKIINKKGNIIQTGKWIKSGI